MAEICKRCGCKTDGKKWLYCSGCRKTIAEEMRWKYKQHEEGLRPWRPTERYSRKIKRLSPACREDDYGENSGLE